MCDVYNGTIDIIVQREREMGNNANFSMQSCALRHFKDYLRDGERDSRLPSICPKCLCLAPCDHSHSCRVTRCFGKCSKLYAVCRLNSMGICEYCVKKYPILYGTTSDRRSRYVEYVHDHALIGRAYDPSKHDRIIRDEILQALRWKRWFSDKKSQDCAQEFVGAQVRTRAV